MGYIGSVVRGWSMRKLTLITLVLLFFVEYTQLQASQAIGSHRFNLRFNGVNRGQSVTFASRVNPFHQWGPQRVVNSNRRSMLPFAKGPNPVVPVNPWAPTNTITFTTNRVMFPDTLHVLFLGNNIIGAQNMATVLSRMSQHVQACQ